MRWQAAASAGTSAARRDRMASVASTSPEASASALRKAFSSTGQATKVARVGLAEPGRVACLREGGGGLPEVSGANRAGRRLVGDGEEGLGPGAADRRPGPCRRPGPPRRRTGRSGRGRAGTGALSGPRPSAERRAAASRSEARPGGGSARTASSAGTASARVGSSSASVSTSAARSRRRARSSGSGSRRRAVEQRPPQLGEAPGGGEEPVELGLGRRVAGAGIERVPERPERAGRIAQGAAQDPGRGPRAPPRAPRPPSVGRGRRGPRRATGLPRRRG